MCSSSKPFTRLNDYFTEYKFLTLSQTTELRLFQTTTLCGRQFWFDENGEKLSKRIENIVGKEEISRYEQFLLFPVFSKDLYCRLVKTWACLGKS